MNSKRPTPLRHLISCSVLQISSLISTKCCTPAPSLCSKYVYICLFLSAPNTGSFNGSNTISLLLANTTEFSLLSLVPTSSAANSANSWNPFNCFKYATTGASSGTLPTVWSTRRSPKSMGNDDPSSTHRDGPRRSRRSHPSWPEATSASRCQWCWYGMRPQRLWPRWPRRFLDLRRWMENKVQ